MKAYLAGILGLSVVAFATPTLADHHHNNGGGGGSGGGGGGHQSHQSHGGGGGGGGHENHGGGHMSFQGSGGGHNFSHGGGHHATTHVTVHHNSYANHNRYSGHVTIHSSRHGAVHGRVNMAHFHHVFRAPHRYRIGVWHAPRGFRYRRFGIGEHIPALLLVPAFFLLDYYDYGLEEPDYGYVWVRDGDDAVLVDRYTGEVIEVEYDVFY